MADCSNNPAQCAPDPSQSLEWRGDFRIECLEMLRITGLIALLVSCALAVLLFSRVKTLRLSGVAWNFGYPPLHVRLDTGPGSVALLSWKTPQSFPGGVGSDDAHRVVGLTFDDVDEAIRGIPHEARVAVIHRGVYFQWLRWAFGGTVIECGDRTYSCERSPAVFLWSLGLISAAPALCWLTFALVTAILHHPRKVTNSV
jgi:hypothetical protein